MRMTHLFFGNRRWARPQQLPRGEQVSEMFLLWFLDRQEGPGGEKITACVQEGEGHPLPLNKNKAVREKAAVVTEWMGGCTLPGNP